VGGWVRLVRLTLWAKEKQERCRFEGVVGLGGFWVWANEQMGKWALLPLLVPLRWAWLGTLSSTGS
jgi:hypothetical protein